jgi:hypothetical protein
LHVYICTHSPAQSCANDKGICQYNTTFEA